MGDVQMPLSRPKPPGHCRECHPTLAVAFLLAPRADPPDTLPADHPLHRSDNAAATPTPWIAAPAGSTPVRRWYVLQNSAPPHATASPHGRPHLFPLPCSADSAADMCWDVTATSVPP